MSDGSIRELARRIGVSDVAINKARANGRIPASLFSVRPSGRPYVIDLEAAERAVRAVLSPAASPGQPRADKARAAAAAKRPAAAPPPDEEPERAPVPPPAAVFDDQPIPMQAGAYQKARAMREAYAAKLAQLDYQQKMGQLVSKDDMKSSLFSAGRQLRDSLTQLPSRLAPQLASETDQHVISMMLATEINAALKELAHAFQRATGDH